MTEPVITRATFGVREDAVGLVYLFKLLLRCMIAGIAIRMVLQRQFSISALQLLFRGAPVDAEDVVIISFAHWFTFASFILDAPTLSGRQNKPGIIIVGEDLVWGPGPGPHTQVCPYD